MWGGVGKVGGGWGGVNLAARGSFEGIYRFTVWWWWGRGASGGMVNCYGVCLCVCVCVCVCRGQVDGRVWGGGGEGEDFADQGGYETECMHV